METGTGWISAALAAGGAAALLAAAVSCGGFDPPDCEANQAVIEVGEDGRVVRGEVINYSSAPRSLEVHLRDHSVAFTFEAPLSPGGSVPVNGALLDDSGLGLRSCSEPPDHGGTLYADDDGGGYTFEVSDLGEMGLLGCWSKTAMVGCVRIADLDRDGVTDTFDECPDEDEDADGFEDEDGCPDPDNDGDGIPDELDACPFEAGPAPEGCPT